MKVFKDIEGFKARNPVLTVGFFDGVHRGHMFILEKMKEVAEKLDGETVLLTLWPHPRTILNQVNEDFRLLNTIEEKQELLDRGGLDHLVTVPFTEEFSRMASDEFIRDYLVGRMGIKHLVVGYNHRFGRDREGSFETLKKYAVEYGFNIEKVEKYQPGNNKLSSSVIRSLLGRGELETANQLLGYSYEVSGKVSGGSRIGSSIGFPTANLSTEPYKLLPADGVYAVYAHLGKDSAQGILNIGSRPTVNDVKEKKTVEVHLLDFSRDIYREQIKVIFVKRLRDEKKFDSLDSLKDQLIKDKEQARRIFGRIESIKSRI